MEPRARAGKNVGKETFQPKDGMCFSNHVRVCVLYLKPRC